MAAGAVSTGAVNRSLKLLEGVTAANGIPSGGSAGHLLNELLGPIRPERFGVHVDSTAGSGTMTATVRIWGRVRTTGTWVVVQALNAGAAIAEVGADKLQHFEVVAIPPALYERLYAEVTAIAGTATAVDVYATIELPT